MKKVGLAAPFLLSEDSFLLTSLVYAKRLLFYFLLEQCAIYRRVTSILKYNM
jgi:hypothetical protein